MPIAGMITPRSRGHGFNSSNPFDSLSDSEEESLPSTISTSLGEYKFSSVDEGKERGASLSSSTAIRHYESDFCDSGGLENQTVQKLEEYAIYKAEKTTEKINDCLKIAEDIKEDASKILVNLHQQGEQITRTHLNVVSVDHNLSRGEKLLSSLGGLFSKSWKPKRSNPIKGPMDNLNDFMANGSGTSSAQSQQSNFRQCFSESKSTIKGVEAEMIKQDDNLSDLSNLLGQLKDMAIDLGSEIERQNAALANMHDDVDTVNARVKGANLRARRLLGK